MDYFGYVNDILRYISYYKNNEEVLKLVAKLYGIMEPEYKIPGMRFYIYLYDCIKNYNKIFERNLISVSVDDPDVRKFTMRELIKIKKIDITFWHDYDEFYQQARMITSTDQYDKLVIACIYNENFGPIFKKYIRDNNKNLVSNTGLEALYNLAEWAIKFNQLKNLKIIMNEIDHFSKEDPLRDSRSIKLVRYAFLSENIDFPEYFRNFFAWDKINFDSDDFSILQGGIDYYLESSNNNKEFLDYLIKNYPNKFLSHAHMIIYGHLSLEQTYRGMDDKTSDVFFEKFRMIAPLADSEGINHCKSILEKLIESFSRTEQGFVSYMNYYLNNKFYIKCYEEVIRIMAEKF